MSMAEGKPSKLFQTYVQDILPRFPIPHYAQCMNCGQKMITTLDVHAPVKKNVIQIYRPLTCSCQPNNTNGLVTAEITAEMELKLNRKLIDS